MLAYFYHLNLHFITLSARTATFIIFYVTVLLSVTELYHLFALSICWFHTVYFMAKGYHQEAHTATQVFKRHPLLWLL
jgi:hypothetical protein